MYDISFHDVIIGIFCEKYFNMVNLIRNSTFCAKFVFLAFQWMPSEADFQLGGVNGPRKHCNDNALTNVRSWGCVNFARKITQPRMTALTALKGATLRQHVFSSQDPETPWHLHSTLMFLSKSWNRETQKC